MTEQLLDRASSDAPAEAAPPARPAASPFRRFLSEFAENRISVVAAAMLAVIIVLALAAPWLTPQNPYDLAQVSIFDSKLPPGSEAFDGYTMWLGSDGAGRDLYSAILYGLRISLTVGLASGVIA
ncbi:MAG: ABC transporter permease, partial [Pseudomonadota bacterium]